MPALRWIWGARMFSRSRPQGVKGQSLSPDATRFLARIEVIVAELSFLARPPKVLSIDLAIAIEESEGADADIRFGLAAHYKSNRRLVVVTPRYIHIAEGNAVGLKRSYHRPLEAFSTVAATGGSISLWGPTTSEVLLDNEGTAAATTFVTTMNHFLESRPVPESAGPLVTLHCGTVRRAYGISSVVVGQPATLTAYPDRIDIRGPGERVDSIPYSDLDLLAVDSPGPVKQGGGFAGGGFGVEGAAVGMLAAGLLNSLTTSVRNDTYIIVRSSNREFVVDSPLTPVETDRLLAPAYAALREWTKKPTTGPIAAPPSLADELAKLAALHASGALDDAEFQAAKQRLIAQ